WLASERQSQGASVTVLLAGAPGQVCDGPLSPLRNSLFTPIQLRAVVLLLFQARIQILEHDLWYLRPVWAAARPGLRSSDSSAAQERALRPPFAVPAAGQIHEVRVLVPPGDVGRERPGERVGLGFKVVGQIEEEIIDLRDGCRNFVVANPLEHNRGQPLVK